MSTLLGVLLLVLKLAHVITWAWWIIALPFIPLAISILLLVGGTLLAGIVAIKALR